MQNYQAQSYPLRLFVRKDLTWYVLEQNHRKIILDNIRTYIKGQWMAPVFILPLTHQTINHVQIQITIDTTDKVIGSIWCEEHKSY